MKTALRWASVPVAAIAGSLILYFLVSLWVKGNNYGYEIINGASVGSITQILLAIAAQAAFGYGFVFSGAWAAPRHKMRTAKVLFAIATVLSIASFVASLYAQGFYFLQLVHNIAMIGGALGAISSIDEIG